MQVQQPFFRPAPPGPGASTHIVCDGCQTLLMYPQGAQNVRCARCSHITPVPIMGGNQMAQLVCTNPNCTVVLMYPRGANQVQCSVCGHVNDAMAANQIGHLICGCCHVTLMYAWGAQSVKCACCNHVTPVNAHTITHPPTSNANAGASGSGAGAARPPGPTGNAAAPGKAVHAVYVENPPSLDENGNEVQNLALGVTAANPETSRPPASGPPAPG
ncbi:hypothetical protein WJX73_000892 [Symbiochloris irregularis]|uniref:Zinc finger LSD1-type domain-containing protein n=1 Tax=Symbiochloris irregularis TaxID=706552 RepID=A0AAW1PRD9_9CHLO